MSPRGAEAVAGDPRAAKAYQQEYFNMARRLAMCSVMRHRHGCVIVRGGEVVSRGWNRTLNYLKRRWSLHAEIDALRGLRTRGGGFLAQCELYVVRVRYKGNVPGELLNSKPCCHCEQMITNFGLARAYYST